MACQLSPVSCQAIIWNNASLLLTGPLEANFYEISIKRQQIWHNKINLIIYKMADILSWLESVNHSVLLFDYYEHAPAWKIQCIYCYDFYLSFLTGLKV